MTRKKNFSNQDTPSIVDTEYSDCNFMHTSAILDGLDWKGHRLFPGDDTPRTFTNCNLANCEVSPGSIVVGCNTTIFRPEVFDFQDAPIEIDGESISINHYKRIVYGRWTPAGYEYRPTPEETLFEREA